MKLKGFKKIAGISKFKNMHLKFYVDLRKNEVFADAFIDPNSYNEYYDKQIVRFGGCGKIKITIKEIKDILRDFIEYVDGGYYYSYEMDEEIRNKIRNLKF